MSALPPKADMCGALAHVGFGPIADSCAAAIAYTFAHLVVAAERSIAFDVGGAILEPRFEDVIERMSKGLPHAKKWSLDLAKGKASAHFYFCAWPYFRRCFI